VARYAAFLRGVMPQYTRNADLVRGFEAAGFTEVRTVLTSGNVVFAARSTPVATLERRAEAAMTKTLGRTFMTFVRPIDALRALLDTDPYARARLPADAKRIVTFLRRPAPARALPATLGDARLLAGSGLEVFGAYRPGPNGPDFMKLIATTLGKDVTTRTWDTVARVAKDA
jgi:uncharacterized protein (DUF1697 family)